MGNNLAYKNNKTMNKQNEYNHNKIERYTQRKDVQTMATTNTTKTNKETKETKETTTKEMKEMNVIEKYGKNLITKEEFAQLTIEEQQDLMKHYRNVFQVNDIKQVMGYSTSSYYKLLKRLGIHEEIARPYVPRNTSAPKKQKEITFDFIPNGVMFEGGLNLQELLEKIEGFVNFGGGNENKFEFRLELTKND